MALAELFEEPFPRELLRGVDANLDATEGPVWHPDGYLLFVRHRRHQLLRWSDTSSDPTVLLDDTGYCTGCTLDRDGFLLMCEGDRRRIVRLDGHGRRVTVADRWLGRRFNKPSDIVCASDGRVFFTDPTGRTPSPGRELDFCGVFSVGIDGVVSLGTAECEYPNGLALSPDESVLYVAITRRDSACLEEGPDGSECRHRIIRAFDVASDGRLVNGRVFANLYASALGGPDGMQVDASGRIYCAGPNGVWVFTAEGERIGVLPVPGHTRSLAFGGPDKRQLFICSGASVFGIRTADSGA